MVATFKMAYVLHIFVAILFFCFSVQAQEGQQKGLYFSTCPKAEDIVRSTVLKFFNNDSTIAPGLLRLHFHDCFVQTGGPSWSVPLGRRDGRVSSASDAIVLPSPTDSVAVQRQKFADNGLTDHDLVTLVGAHTIGQTDCLFLRYRLYNFTATGNADPTINGAFLGQLQISCPQKGKPSKLVALDKDSMSKFDVSYFKNVRDGNAVLESDQRLWGDAVTQNIVQNYAGTILGLLGLRFDYEFLKSMVKMSSIGI